MKSKQPREAEPRLTYSCPKCWQRIVRVFTAAQLGTRLPAAVHAGLEPGGQMSPLSGVQGVYSAALQRFRAKGDHVSFLGVNTYPLLTQADITVACNGCRSKFSVPAHPLI